MMVKQDKDNFTFPILDSMIEKDSDILLKLKNSEDNTQDDDIFVDFTQFAESNSDPAVQEENSIQQQKNIKKIVWVSKPPEGKTKEECLADPELYRIKSTEIKIFDLSEENDLKMYNYFLTEDVKQDTNIVLSHEKKWSEMSDTWKIFLQITTLEFKKL